MLLIPGIFGDFLIESRKIWWDENFEKLQIVHLGLQLAFQKEHFSFHEWKFFQNNPKYVENSEFSSFFTFLLDFLYHFRATSLHEMIQTNSTKTNSGIQEAFSKI